MIYPRNVRNHHPFSQDVFPMFRGILVDFDAYFHSAQWCQSLPRATCLQVDSDDVSWRWKRKKDYNKIANGLSK